MVFFYQKQLKKYNTFRLNVKAKFIFKVYSIKELLNLWKIAKIRDIPVLLLGYGSNTLFVNKYFCGLVILNRITYFKVIEFSRNWVIKIGSGNIWHNVVKNLISNGIYGLENLALIPGSVGGAVVQNIGAYGLEFEKVCYYVDVLDLENGKFHKFKRLECGFSYRNSIFKKKKCRNFFIVSVEIKLSKNWKPILRNFSLLLNLRNKIIPENIFNVICRLRKRKLPNFYKFGNAGSFFKNPVIPCHDFFKSVDYLKFDSKSILNYFNSKNNLMISAGWLIERCGLKGFKYKGVEVYKKQALILVNLGHASGKSVIKLAKLIYKEVLKNFTIKLEPEVRIIGKNQEINPKKIFL